LSAGKRRPTAFLTYSHADKEIVKQVAHQLLEQGVNVWYDAHQIGAGDNIADRVDRGVESADFLVFFMSESSLRSAWVTREVDAAITRQASGSGVRVLPVLLDNSALPPLFRSVHYVDLRDDNVENAVRVLLRAIHRSEP
jgi:hypothetical protein